MSKSIYIDVQDIETYENIDMESLLLEYVTPVAVPSHDIVAFKLYKDDYDVYGQLEKHLSFSERLVFLNKRGHYLIDNIRKTKVSGNIVVETVVMAIRHIVKCKTLGSCTLMNELYCYLDEAMFHDIEDEIDTFYVDDDSYPITTVYYGQEAWLGDVEVQEFQFSCGENFEEGELMILACFFNDYITLLEKILDNTDAQRVKTTVGKITSHIERAKSLIIETIGNSF